jgi:type III pantothenate kinase
MPEGLHKGSPCDDAKVVLALDVGNTNVTLGLVVDGALTGSRRAITPRTPTPDELELLLAGLLELEGRRLGEIEAISLASVVPAVTDALQVVTERRSMPLLEATAETVPIPIRVDRPAEAGADRLVNALAVQRLYGKPAIVLDFGSATTLDVVAKDGAYLGGAIAPGLELGLEALARNTAKLPRIELRVPEHAIGSNTEDAMRSGAIHGYIGLGRELLERTRAELAASEGVEPSVIRTVATGGLAHQPWVAEIGGIDAIDTDLTLKGLAILYHEHHERSRQPHASEATATAAPARVGSGGRA